MIFVTGGAGFIGSNFIHYWIKNKNGLVLNIDKVTYAGNLENLQAVESDTRYIFSKTDICDLQALRELFEKYQPESIVHFAAESHVDRSISKPAEFIFTNIVGTFNLLEAGRLYWNSLSAERKSSFRFIHVSTDEVFGSLNNEDPAFTEDSKYAPNSPYSASKASSDHLVRSYFHTYNFPVITTNCSNNYGPYQYPEKLIPVVIQSCLENKNIPIYAKGENIRDWLFVDDHCEAIVRVLSNGKIGETYNIGGESEIKNIEVVDTICSIMDELKALPNGKSYKELKKFVMDRPGHDWRYAMNIKKINNELNWKPTETFVTGIRKTVLWYLENQRWIANIKMKKESV